MGWSYGTKILDILVETHESNLETDQLHEELVEIYTDVVNVLIENEWEPTHDSVGLSDALDEVLENIEPSLFEKEEEARRLAAERALQMTASGRVAVPAPGPRRLEELFRARELLEPELAIRALPNVEKSTISALRAIDAAIDGYLAEGDAVGYVQANNAFHTTLYALAGAPALMALVESIWLQTAPVMRRIYGRLGTAALTDYHAATLAALDAHDAVALADAIRADVAQGVALLRQAALDETGL